MRTLTLVLLILAFTTVGCGPKPRPPGLRPNVVVVVSDTLRRVHLGVYGNPRDVSPRLDAFARSSTLFERAFAQSPSTKPSIASLFTSRHPHQHGVIYNEHALETESRVLAEVFRDAGYATAGFVENPMIGSRFKFDQGFDVYELDQLRHGGYAKHDPDLDRHVKGWVSDNTHREFFLYVHYIDPHSPYWAPEGFRGRYIDSDAPAGTDLRVDSSNVDDVERAIAQYDEEIAYMDWRFGRLMDALEELGVRDDSIVVFLSDHGEAFGEHGHFHHSNSVYCELIDIPLMISAPEKLAPGTRTEPAQHVDLFPTLLDLAGVSSDGLELEGDSLADANAEALESRILVSEHLRNGWGSRQRAAIQGNWKLVEHLDSGETQIFDTAVDPADSVDQRHRVPPAVRSRLEATLYAIRSQGPRAAAEEVALDADTEAALRVLGYITEADTGSAPKR